MQSVREHVNAVFKTKRDGNVRPVSFRASALPFCPIIFAEDLKVPEHHQLGFSQRFYVEIGKVLHTIWQDAMVNGPKGAECYGDWKCKTCHKIYPRGMRPEKYTPCCDGEWIYVELSLDYDGISGHIDMITFDGTDWIIWDLKSTTLDTLKFGRKRLPWGSNVHQIYCYALLVKWLYGITVRRGVLLYITREKPDPELAYPYLVSFDRDTQAEESKRLELALDGFAAVQKLVAHPSFENVKRVVNLRPCYSAQDYARDMKGGFVKSDCPHWKSGACAKSRVPLMLDHIEDLYPEEKR